MDNTNYRPMPQVLDHLRQVTLVAVIGPTAVGKSTLMKEAAKLEPQLHMALNHTSRAPRPGERNGVDYHFHTKEAMLERIQRREYVEVAPNVLGDIYATEAADYPTGGVAMLAILAEAMPLFRDLPFKEIRMIFVVPPSFDEWQQRLKAHNFTPDHLKKRLEEGARSLDFAMHEPGLFFVVNDDLEKAAQRFANLALGKPLTAELQQEQERGRELARSMLAQLSTLS